MDTIEKPPKFNPPPPEEKKLLQIWLPESDLELLRKSTGTYTVQEFLRLMIKDFLYD